MTLRLYRGLIGAKGKGNPAVFGIEIGRIGRVRLGYEPRKKRHCFGGSHLLARREGGSSSR
jgi:hypothetical protein